ncbi:MAG: TerC family integral membrane protein [uncultured bacterium]|nr:MAG: TerC family integral membrane protein [uncultured bacterium]
MDYGALLIDLITLTALEIILGIDNLVFVAILSNRLPKSQQCLARRTGLILALFARYGFLLAIIWIVQLKNPLFNFLSHTVSGRDIFMFLGGLFLLVKGTWEIHNEIEPRSIEKEKSKKEKRYNIFWLTIIQIIIFDLVFSLDSILTAVGLTTHLWIMMIAITIAMVLMILSSNPLSIFIQKHPAVKMLALSFLLLIGVVLISDGLGLHIPRAYIYCSIFFSLFVEALNAYRRKKIEKK